LLPILFAVALIAGCGASTADETPTVESGGLKQLAQVPAPSGPAPSWRGAAHDAFLRGAFDDAQALWQTEFRGAGLTYRPARLTIFSQQISSACGTHAAGTGPFYCPASFGVYLDPSFFAALSRKVNVRIGDFAQAYVIAHELGHHVQTLLGITSQRAAANHQDPAGANARSVRFELQADCLAGVWMHSVYRRGELTESDLAAALDAAAVVGDDFMQSATGQARPPEDWTHGSSAQRRHWVTRGFEDGRPESCDTFAG
jgi:predicted metalloprotease